MKVNTKAYGSVEVDERQSVTFPEGLFGFESLKNYVLLDAEHPYIWLQSTEESDAAFVLIDPFLFRPDYEMDIGDDDLRAIGITKPEDGIYFTVVTIPSGGRMTANLQGPIVINREKKLGKQVVLNDPRWKTKHDILTELDSPKKALC